MRIGIRICLVCVSCSLYCINVSADDKAKEFYEEGKAHFQAGRFEEALNAFNEAYNLTLEPALLFNLGASAEAMGDRERAKAYYLVYLEESPDAPDEAEVRSRIEKLSQDPEPPSSDTQETEETQQITTSTENVDASTYYASNQDKKKHATIWPSLMIGLGGMTLVGGMISAIVAKSRYDGLESSCKPNCTDNQVSDAKAPAVAADVLFVLGGIAATAGVVGLVITKKRSRKQSSIAIEVVPGALGLTLEGRF